MAERKLEVRILGDSRSLERAFGNSTRSAQKFERGMSGVGRAAAGLTKAFAVAAAGIGALAVVGAAELQEQAKVSAQTATVLRNLGKTAGLTTKQVEGLASSLQASTGAADDQVALRDRVDQPVAECAEPDEDHEPPGARCHEEDDPDEGHGPTDDADEDPPRQIGRRIGRHLATQSPAFARPGHEPNLPKIVLTDPTSDPRLRKLAESKIMLIKP